MRRPHGSLTVTVLLLVAIKALIGVPHAGSQSRSATAQTLPRPRTAAPYQLQRLWRTSSEEFLYPIDVHFSNRGLLVFDQGAHAVKVLDQRTGRILSTFGRQGSGPGEFAQPVQFFGSAKAIYTVQFGVGRVADVSNGEVRALRSPSGGRWASGCLWGDNQVMLQTASRGQYDNFTGTLGDSARIIDSVLSPFPELAGRPFMERQAQLRQANESTCAVLPLYQRYFGLIAPGMRPLTGTHVEALPPAVLQVTEQGNVRTERLRSGARAGAIDARLWRDRLLVLFVGTSPNRMRIIDTYSRSDLAYTGSILLPFEAQRLAISGDTLALIGDQSGEPFVAAFLIKQTPRGGARPR